MSRLGKINILDGVTGDERMKGNNAFLTIPKKFFTIYKELFFLCILSHFFYFRGI